MEHPAELLHDSYMYTHVNKMTLCKSYRLVLSCIPYQYTFIPLIQINIWTTECDFSHFNQQISLLWQWHWNFFVAKRSCFLFFNQCLHNLWNHFGFSIVLIGRVTTPLRTTDYIIARALINTRTIAIAFPLVYVLLELYIDQWIR